MSKTTLIAYVDSTVNPIMGCDGCELWHKDLKACYAGRQVGRYAGRPGYPVSFDKPQLFASRLVDACRWSDLTGSKRPQKPWLDGRPRTIFVNSLSDTFTESIDPGWLTPLMPTVFAARHRFLFLSKRARRLVRFFGQWPFPPTNCYLGVSITRNSNLARGHELGQLKNAQVRYLSFEPLWELVSLVPLLVEGFRPDWVIAGGQSGPQAGPSHVNWFRTLAEQCAHEGIPFAFQGWGDWVHESQLPVERSRGKTDYYCWPDGSKSFRVGEYRYEGQTIGGYYLDGRRHTGMPAERYQHDPNYVRTWLEGKPLMPPPPASATMG